MPSHLASLGCGGAGFTPASIADLAGWYRADALALANNAPVASWADGSGTGNLLSQGTGVSQPLFKTNIVNGKPVVRFDGANDWLEYAGAPGGFGAQTGQTIFLVAQYAVDTDLLTAVTTNPGFNALQVFFGGGNPRFQGSMGAAIATVTGAIKAVGVWHSTVLRFDDITDGLECFTNGVFQTNNFEAGAFATNTITLGRRSAVAGLYFAGDIAEVGIYSRSLTSPELTRLHAYLAGKYNL
jgi:hypothetical protein